MAMDERYVLTAAQVADGDNNNTSGKRWNNKPVINSDGWFVFGTNRPERFDIFLTATNVTTGFNVILYAEKIDGTEHEIKSVSFTSNGTQTMFQDTNAGSYDKIKIKMDSRTDGTLDAEIHIS